MYAIEYKKQDMDGWGIFMGADELCKYLCTRYARVMTEYVTRA